MDWNKIFTIHIFDKALVSKIHKELVWLRKIANNPTNGQIIWIGTTHKMIYNWLIGLWKADQNCYLSRKHKLKLERDTTIYILKPIKLKGLTMPSVGENIEKLELPYTSGRNANIAITSENSLQFLIKLNVQLLYIPAISLSGI